MLGLNQRRGGGPQVENSEDVCVVLPPKSEVPHHAYALNVAILFGCSITINGKTIRRQTEHLRKAWAEVQGNAWGIVEERERANGRFGRALLARRKVELEMMYLLF